MATTNDGFHEIQLNGKQLVFLFMAVTVVSVVIFLMGVLVGRGVRATQVPLADAPPMARAAGDDEVQAAPPVEEAPPTPDDAPAASGKSDVVDELTKAQGPAGLSTPAPAKKAEAARAPAAPAPPPPAPARAAAAPGSAPVAAKVPTEPPGAGWTIQVAALDVQRDAEAMVTRLLGKQYPAYLVLPTAGGPAKYRVRVGKFADKSEADRTAGRLTKEEKFKPWVIK